MPIFNSQDKILANSSRPFYVYKLFRRVDIGTRRMISQNKAPWEILEGGEGRNKTITKELNHLIRKFSRIKVFRYGFSNTIPIFFNRLKSDDVILV